MAINQMLDELIKREGGFSHLPADKGGATKWGITQSTLSRWRGHNVTVEDVRTMPAEEAKDIYRDLYYTKPNIDKLPEPLNNLIFDFAVNSGPQRAIMALQESLGITADGILGPVTLAATLAANQHELINKVVKWRIMMFARIVKKDPSQLTFLAGWLDRALSFIA